MRGLIHWQGIDGQTIARLTAKARRCDLPAGLDQAWYVTAHGGLTQHVTAEAELAVHAMRTTGQAAAVTHARSTCVTWLLLQSYGSFPTRFWTCVQIDDDSFQRCTLGGVLGNGELTLQLTVLHALLGHFPTPISCGTGI